MNEPRSWSAPIVAACLLLVPAVYVGSYYCAVDTNRGGYISLCGPNKPDLRYRVAPEVCGRFYWPIEQVDRKLRPEAWEDPLIKLITSSFEPEPWDTSKDQNP
jgi:hypothetical protein